VLGIVPFAAGIAGYLFTRLSLLQRLSLFTASALLLVPATAVSVAGLDIPVLDAAGTVLLILTAAANWKRARR